MPTPAPESPVNTIESGTETPKKFPSSCFFIFVTAFCERCSYYGVREMLLTYLTEEMDYNREEANIIIFTFTLFCYMFPIFGSLVADNYMDKYHTIRFLSVIYITGIFFLAVNASLYLSYHNMILPIIAFGAGGVGPCLATFGGDQFVLPQQTRQLSSFYLWYYLSVNLGALLAVFITPNTEEEFGFWLPLEVMAIALIVFVLGKVGYKIVPPANKNALYSFNCICYAIVQRCRTREKKSHWLEHASPKYDDQLIEDLKVATPLLVLFMPLPLFWTLYFQQWTVWNTEHDQMNHFKGHELLRPTYQLEAVNPLCILITIPCLNFIIYPFLAKINLHKPQLRIIVGGFLASLAFIIAAFVAIEIEKQSIDGLDDPLHNKDVGHVILANFAHCDLQIRLWHDPSTPIYNINTIIRLPNDTIYKLYNIPVIRKPGWHYEQYHLDAKGKCLTKTHYFDVHHERTRVALYMFETDYFEPSLKRHKDGFPLIWYE